jgi:carbon-monoxide dehydrogenase medium subunit
MKAAAFAYVRADSIAHAIELLQKDKENVRILAGGQSLGPMLNLRLARPATLVDVKRIPALRLLEADGRVMRLGACWTHAEIEDGVVEDVTRGLLPTVARGIAYRAVRNRGTMGGSLAHADPAADWIAAMTVLGAGIVVRGPDHAERHCRAEAFMRGAFATDLARDEMITAIEVPRLSPDARWGYYKLCRKRGEFASAIGAAVIDNGGAIARVVCGATDQVPLAMAVASERLAKAGPGAAIAAVPDEISTLLQHRDETSRGLHVVAVQRALRQLA